MGVQARPGLAAVACGSGHLYRARRDALLGAVPVVRVDLSAGLGLRVARRIHSDPSRWACTPGLLPCPGPLSSAPAPLLPKPLNKPQSLIFADLCQSAR